LFQAGLCRSEGDRQGATVDAAIAAQAGWSERSVTRMVETYGHAVDERRLDEIDAAFAGPAEAEAGRRAVQA
jgi:hypothetical protein